MNMNLGNFTRATPVAERIKLFESDVKRMKFYMSLIEEELAFNDGKDRELDKSFLHQQYCSILHKYSCKKFFNKMGLLIKE